MSKIISFNGGIEITVKDLISFMIILSTIVYTIAIMPSQIMASATTRFASREKIDMVDEQLSRIEGKLDRLISDAPWWRNK